MKQAYLIEVEAESYEAYKTVLKAVTTDFTAGPGVAYKKALEAIEKAIPLSKSLVWQAKRDASMEKAK